MFLCRKSQFCQDAHFFHINWILQRYSKFSTGFHMEHHKLILNLFGYVKIKKSQGSFEEEKQMTRLIKL